MYRLLIALSGCLPLCGCIYTVKEVADPPQITVQQALADVGDGLKILREKTADGKFGLIVDEVKLVFNVSAKATDTKKLGISTTGTPLSVGGLLAANANADLVSEANRGNNITITLKNVATADLKGDKTFIEKCKANPIDCGVLFQVR